MKVTLDACLFGALCDVKESQRILDIGTGTGLLALMSAQRSEGNIDALELDPNASQQAKNNVENSPFAGRIQVIQQDIKQFISDEPYDTILCNPPFFSDHLKGPNAQRNQARHNDHLSFDDLCASITRLLSKQGKAWILLPCHEFSSFSQKAQQHQLNVSYGWVIQSKPNKPSHRYVFCLEHEAGMNGRSEIAISEFIKVIIHSESSGEYSSHFKSLLADFYLKL